MRTCFLLLILLGFAPKDPWSLVTKNAVMACVYIAGLPSDQYGQGEKIVLSFEGDHQQLFDNLKFSCEKAIKNCGRKMHLYHFEEKQNPISLHQRESLDKLAQIKFDEVNPKAACLEIVNIIQTFYKLDDQTRT